MLYKLVFSALATIFATPFLSFAQTPAPVVFEIVGKEISVSEMPVIKGRWFNPQNGPNSTNKFRFEDGNLFIWTTRKCGEDQRKIIKIYKEGSTFTAETGGSKDTLRCDSGEGAFFKFDTAVKNGTYHVKVAKDSLEILRSGRLELD